MTNQYTCPCSNVQLEVAPKIEEDTTDLNEIHAVLNAADDGSDELVGFIKQKFLVGEDSYLTKVLTTKIKYQLLTGVLTKALHGCDPPIELNMCLVCDVLTHCTFKLRKEFNNSKTKVLENTIHSSHSDSMPSKNNNSVIQVISVNSKEMILNPAKSQFTDAENYSSVYDIVLDDKKLAKFSNSFDEFKLKINQVPIFEQRIFLNQIEEKYRNMSPPSENNISQEKLARKLEDLVNYLLAKEQQLTTYFSLDAAKSRQQHIQSQSSMPMTTTDELHGGVNNKSVVQNIVKVKKGPVVNKYDDDLGLSSSVFDMEDIDEMGETCGKFEGSGEESDEEEQGSQFERSILKKRNSNIGEMEGGAGPNGSRQILFANTRKDLQPNQYSCSLPRDIPVMQHNRHNSTNTKQQPNKLLDNNENYYNPVREQHKHHTQLIANSYQQPNSTYLLNNHFTPNNNTSQIQSGHYADELFVDDSDNDEAFLDADASNMGQAISSLASSIVVKDGRELFGGVPSRRVPINSISKSCYE